MRKALTWQSVAAHRIVIMFVVKQRWVYALVMCDLDGAIVCDSACSSYGNEKIAFDAFRTDVSKQCWYVPFLNSSDSMSGEIAYPSPYMRNTRFATQIEFDATYGCFKHALNIAVSEWYAVCDYAYAHSRSYYSSSFEIADTRSAQLFDVLWRTSTARAYTVRRSSAELWRSYRARQIAAQRAERAQQRRAATALAQLRRRNIDYSSIELIAFKH